MKRKTLFIIIITYFLTILHCILDVISGVRNMEIQHSQTDIVLDGVFLISISLLIETIIFSLVLILRIKEYWKIFVPIIFVTGVISGHYIFTYYSTNRHRNPAPQNKTTFKSPEFNNAS